jgi:hypothetical protein
MAGLYALLFSPENSQRLYRSSRKRAFTLSSFVDKCGVVRMKLKPRPKSDFQLGGRGEGRGRVDLYCRGHGLSCWMVL